MMYVSPEQQQHQHFQAQQAYPLRRAGSMNAKIMSQDARRPFAATVGQQRGDAEYGIVALPDDYQSPNNSLPRGSSMRKGEGIIPADGGQDGNNPPYPGVIIEEMFDSASQVG